MAAQLLWFLGSALVVVGAGIVLSRTADCIAERTGFGRLAVGVVLLAGATTLPEIFRSASAVRLGAPDMAVGTIIGSCTQNILLLALMDLVHHLEYRQGLSTRLVIGHSRAATLSIIVLAVTALALHLGHMPSLWGVGVAPVLVAAIYLAGLRMAVRVGEEAPATPPTLPSPATCAMSLGRALLWFGVAALALVLAAPRLAGAAEALATASGLGLTFFGTIFVTLVTCLPEAVASFTALRLGAYDLAVGNLFGSNAFNVTLILLLDVVHRSGPILEAVSKTHLVSALVGIVLTGIALQNILTRDERRSWLVEPDAVVLLLAYLAGVGVIYLAR